MKMDYKFEDDMGMEMSEMTGHDGHTHKEYRKEHEETKDYHKDQKHKLMTMEDVANELANDFADEIADSKKYFCMAKIAERAGDHGDCHYLIEMSKDEYTHAYFIHSFMTEHNMHIPEEQEEEFAHLSEKMKDFFQ